MSNPLPSLLASVAALGVFTSHQTPSDSESIDSLINATYSTISVAPGEEVNWDRFRGLFYKGAQLIGGSRRPDGSFSHRAMSVEDYISGFGPTIKASGFNEREIGRKVEQYGNVVCVRSAYEARRKADDEKPFARGVNFFQLMNDGKRWWTISLVWQQEDPTTPVPAELIKK